MLDFAKIQQGQTINARDIRFLKQYVEENAARPFEGTPQNIREIPCVLNVGVLRYQFLQISPASFFDDATPWITTSASGGSNWVMFEEEYDAGQTGVCKVIPYDMPVMLRTGGSPQNGHRYNLPSLEEDVNGEFTCVGTAKDPMVFWYVRNAGVGGATPETQDINCIIITCPHNGFTDAPIFKDSLTLKTGFNAIRAGLGILSNADAAQPLSVYEVSNGALVHKDGLFYKKLTIKQHSGASTPEYSNYGTIQYNEYSGNDHALLYAFLSSLQAGESDKGIKYDYSDQWETTTDPTQAIPNNYTIIQPHSFTGFYPPENAQYKVLQTLTANISQSSRTAVAPLVVLDFQFDEQVKFTGQINFPIYKSSVSSNNITWTQINTIEYYLSNTGILVLDPQYNGTNLECYDNNVIENRCGDVPVVLGLTSSDVPQFVFCDTIPFACCIPVLKVECLYRVTMQSCSPSYTVNRYNAILKDNQIVLQTANYLPGSINCQ